MTASINPTKPTFKICANCGAYAPTAKRVCNSPKGCGVVSREDRRNGRKSVWNVPTAAQVEARNAKRAAMEALINKLAGSEE